MEVRRNYYTMEITQIKLANFLIYPQISYEGFTALTQLSHNNAVTLSCIKLNMFYIYICIFLKI